MTEPTAPIEATGASESTKPRTTRATRSPESRAARRARLEASQAVGPTRTAVKRRPRIIPRKRVLDPDFMIDPPREPGPHRPWSVTLGGLLVYILAALFLTQGVQNPSNSTGTGGDGIAFIVIGTVLLALGTFALQGRPLARVCLIIPMVIGSVVVLRDDTQPWWLRSGSGALTVVIVALFLLEPRARRFFGDDDTPLQLTKREEQ